jgi:hypothetical protein
MTEPHYRENINICKMRQKNSFLRNQDRKEFIQNTLKARLHFEVLGVELKFDYYGLRK